MAIAAAAIISTALGLAYYHISTDHPAPEQPAFQPGDKVTQDKTSGLWRKSTEQDDQEDIRTVRGYSGHRRQAETLKLVGHEIWLTDNYKIAQTYSKYGPKAAVATIASKTEAGKGSTRFDNGYEPDLPTKEDGYVTIAVERSTPDRDQRFPAKTARCLEEHVKPALGIQSPNSEEQRLLAILDMIHELQGKDKMREAITDGPCGIN